MSLDNNKVYTINRKILIIKNDTLILKKLSTQDIKIVDKKIKIIESNLSEFEINKWLKKIIPTIDYDNVYLVDFFVEFREDVYKMDDIKNIGIYFIRNDSIKFDYHNLQTNTKKSFGNLSDSYCNVPLVLISEETQIKNPTILEFKLPRNEMPNYNKLILVEKHQDTLYGILQKFYKKHESIND